MPLAPESAGFEPPERGRYRHFKGNEYEVLDVALHSETQEPMVVYRRLSDPDQLWVRPLHMWSEHVDRDGYSGPRFAWIGHGPK
jgi:hypothetical protein